MSFQRPTSTQLSDNPIVHKGFLKKQGGKMKSWKHRLFVLVGQVVTYYERDENSKPLGSFSVKGCDLEVLDVVHDHEAGEECNKFDFMIKTGVNGSRLAGHHESFLLSATSENERNVWVCALKRAMYRDKGGAIFGMPLQEVMSINTCTSDIPVPLVVHDCCEYIRQYGIEDEGIFRLSGRKKAIEHLAQTYDRGERPAKLAPPTHDLHTVCSLLKRFFSELPDPVVPYHLYDDLKKAGYYVEEQPERVKSQLEKLPMQNYTLLKYICLFLQEVASHSHKNKMTEANLANVFAPNILRCQDRDPSIEASASDMTRNTMLAFISKADVLFCLQFKSFGTKASSMDFLNLPATSSGQSQVSTSTPGLSHATSANNLPQKTSHTAANVVGGFLSGLSRNLTQSRSFRSPLRPPPPPPPVRNLALETTTKAKPEPHSLLGVPGVPQLSTSPASTTAPTIPPPTNRSATKPQGALLSPPVPASNDKTPSLYPKLPSEVPNISLSQPNKGEPDDAILNIRELGTTIRTLKEEREKYKSAYEKEMATNRLLQKQVDEYRQMIQVKENEVQALMKLVQSKLT